MSHTIDDFRNFFRPDKEKSDFSISGTINGTLDFMKPSLTSHGIAIEFEETEDVVIQGYANEYTQVLLNLVNNAKDVLITRKIANPRIKFRVMRKNGRSVVMVADNGGGIDTEILPKIFDPYFTTKEQTQGTGIGLYMSKAIIEGSMGGRLTASNVDDGAEFRIEV
jgi:C4-dicarboxylate-specific signal transduction histidine kinase